MKPELKKEYVELTNAIMADAASGDTFSQDIASLLISYQLIFEKACQICFPINTNLELAEMLDELIDAINYVSKIPKFEN